MTKLLLAAGIALALGGCATTSTQMAWGKPGVTKQDYGTDVGMCTGLASKQSTGDGQNTAGGVNGKNGASGSAGAADAAIPAGGSYSGMASSDYAQRAATQQRTREMAEQRARSDALKNCLVERGYREFPLTAEQVAHLATLQKGSNEYLEYLYKLGSDAEIVDKQSRTPAK
jgi:hypothetical protein